MREALLGYASWNFSLLLSPYLSEIISLPYNFERCQAGMIPPDLQSRILLLDNDLFTFSKNRNCGNYLYRDFISFAHYCQIRLLCWCSRFTSPPRPTKAQPYHIISIFLACCMLYFFIDHIRSMFLQTCISSLDHQKRCETATEKPAHFQPSVQPGGGGGLGDIGSQISHS